MATRQNKKVLLKSSHFKSLVVNVIKPLKLNQENKTKRNPFFLNKVPKFN